MKLLRLYCPLQQAPSRCKWALIDSKAATSTGTSAIKDLPRRADRVQLVIPAPDILITRARLPAAANRGSGSVLAFALEEQTATDPDANQVSLLGKVGDASVLAVFDRRGLGRWREALGQAGVQGFEVHSEMLFLPREADEWSVAWNGADGFVRTGKLEAAATDSGSKRSPPLALRMLLEHATKNGERPGGLVVYSTSEDAIPDVDSWQESLGIPVRIAGAWAWHGGTAVDGVALAQEKTRWGGAAAVFSRLRLAAWIVGIALAVHGLASIVDWTMLANEQRTLRQKMDARFRATFPDAVAVVDPLLQMRRKLAEVRHVAGQPDAGDFLPMLGKVATTIKDLPAGTVRILSFEAGRVTMELSTADVASVERILSRLMQAGMIAEKSASSTGPGRAVVTVRIP